MKIKKFLYGFNLILLGFFISGVILLICAPPKSNPISLSPIPTEIPIQVFISGSVKNPGIYILEKNSRLSDLVEKAGGFTTSEFTEYNLASKLYDGQHVQIGKLVETAQKISGIESIKLNINEADIDSLCSLPGIGPSKAAEIILYREQYGFYEKIEDILNVPGIGETTFSQIKDLIVTNQIQNK
jgi:competence protein ComEA